MFREVISIIQKHNKSVSESKLNFLKIFVIMIFFTLLFNIAYVLPSEALTRFYNCVARVANKNSTLTISNVDNCYNLIFKGALNYYGMKQPQSTSDNSTVMHQGAEKQTYPEKVSEPGIGKLPQKTESVDIFG